MNANCGLCGHRNAAKVSLRCFLKIYNGHRISTVTCRQPETYHDERNGGFDIQNISHRKNVRNINLSLHEYNKNNRVITGMGKDAKSGAEVPGSRNISAHYSAIYLVLRDFSQRKY
jgi:hypothetical protein